MTEPSHARPLPGPPRPGPASGSGGSAGGALTEGRPGSSAGDGAGTPAQPSATTGVEQAGSAPFVDLEQRPVAEHVGVFEAEHARLQRELGTIDQL